MACGGAACCLLSWLCVMPAVCVCMWIIVRGLNHDEQGEQGRPRGVTRRRQQEEGKQRRRGKASLSSFSGLPPPHTHTTTIYHKDTKKQATFSSSSHQALVHLFLVARPSYFSSPSSFLCSFPSPKASFFPHFLRCVPSFQHTHILTLHITRRHRNHLLKKTCQP